MRGTGDHTPPAEMQERPIGNSGQFIAEQVGEWRRTDKVIHTECAREIAAWFQSPSPISHAFTRFAGTGYLDVHSLLHVIAREAGKGREVFTEKDMWKMLPIDYLSALAAYAVACPK